ncbi:MAG: hypothetical protein R3A48_02665 [Polyangiales bacterium]
MTRDPNEVGEQARAIVERFYILTRNVAVHGDTHPLVGQNAEALAAAMDAAAPPYALQFVGQAVFIDRVLAVLDALNFSRSLKLARYLAAVGVNEVGVEYTPSSQNLIALARALLSRDGAAPSVDGLHLREIRGVSGGGGSGEVIDPELFATAQMVRSLIESEGLEASLEGGWSWSSGISVVRRVERARNVDLAACLRFIEFAPGPRSVPRRALGALVTVLSPAGGLARGLRARALWARRARGRVVRRGGRDYPAEADRDGHGRRHQPRPAPAAGLRAAAERGRRARRTLAVEPPGPLGGPRLRPRAAALPARPGVRPLCP